MLGRLVTIAAFENAMQANLVKNHLEAAGIRCALADEFTASSFWHLSNAIGGVKVQVAEENLERASLVLDALEGKRRDDPSEGVPADDESPVAQAPDTEMEQVASKASVPEPKPGDDEDDEPPLNEREDNVERAYRTVLIGYMIWPLQLYAAWLLLDVWQSDLPLRPAIQRRLYWAIGLHLPMLIVAVIVIGLMLRGASSEFPWLQRGY
jgi:Putative prokaryotic signal transducing protein